MSHAHMEQISPEMQACISICHECHDSCLTTLHHCLHMGGEHASPHHIGLLQDCAQICHTSEDFMLRQSEFHASVCGVCAEICDHCAQECETMANGDAQMLACAATCRRCAESCRRMANMVM